MRNEQRQEDMKMTIFVDEPSEIPQLEQAVFVPARKGSQGSHQHKEETGFRTNEDDAQLEVEHKSKVQEQ